MVSARSRTLFNSCSATQKNFSDCRNITDRLWPPEALGIVAEHISLFFFVFCWPLVEVLLNT